MNKFSKNHFNGGGHKNAAGGKILNMGLQDTIKYFIELLAEYENVNYLLKVDKNEIQIDLDDILKKIKSIPQIITLYNINKDLKNKEHLIFL